MSSEFTKSNLDLYLKALGKEFRRLNGTKTPAEIILVGGAAIIANYVFRDSTTDIDAIMNASSALKDAITRVGDKNGLQYGWINADFIKTASFSQKLSEVSVYYKTFSNVLTVRTVSAEYLIAMKLRSAREYKSDISDVIGILLEHEKRGTPLTLDKISNAVAKLYGGWVNMPEQSKDFISNVIAAGDYEKRYKSTRAREVEAKHNLIEFEKKYPNTLNESNIHEIIQNLSSDSNPPDKRPSVRARLQELQQQQRDAATSRPVVGKSESTRQDLPKKHRDDYER